MLAETRGHLDGTRTFTLPSSVIATKRTRSGFRVSFIFSYLYKKSISRRVLIPCYRNCKLAAGVSTAIFSTCAGFINGVKISRRLESSFPDWPITSPYMRHSRLFCKVHLRLATLISHMYLYYTYLGTENIRPFPSNGQTKLGNCFTLKDLN